MVRTALSLTLALVLGAGAAFATSITTDWAGVYKHRFQSGMTSGERYEVEDVLEIVRLDDQSAYVRTRLHFYNGHTCALHGVAQVEGESLVFREPNPPSNREQCVVTLTRRDGQMVFNQLGDFSECVSYCGARGSFRNRTFPVSSQRQIRYMDRLRASWQYTEAVRAAGREP